MEDKLIESLISSGVPAIVIIAGLYFGKNLIEHFFNETIELKKKELEQENKNFQHQLDAKLQEFNIKFSNLHSERAEVIKNLYMKLIELQSSMFTYTRRAHIIIDDGIKEKQERTDRVNLALKEFSNYYFPNKIFFNSSITLKIDSLINDYYKIGWDFTDVLYYIENKFDLEREDIKSNFEKMKELSIKVEKDFPILIDELAEEFKEILGVNN
ncbi:hypothetical protein [Flavobacterium sp. UBA6195]|uniref:hypothetical protein n=1 Tax=Flavobacterium sp. UBA6195 TaxID=1946554 RepID=UPI0025BC8BBB|nr:hypothetical protein [Flavobacterium sp. UBA6195]